MSNELTPEEEAGIDEIADEITTAIVDAFFIKAGLLNDPTTKMGRDAYAKARKE